MKFVEFAFACWLISVPVVVEGKFKSGDKSCRSCRGFGDVRLEGISNDIKTVKVFDPARVETTIKEVATELNKVCFSSFFLLMIMHKYLQAGRSSIIVGKWVRIHVLVFIHTYTLHATNTNLMF